VIEEVCDVCTVRAVPHGLPPCQKKKEPEEKPKFFFQPKAFDVKPEETPDGQGAKDYPPLSLQLYNYKQALTKWQEAGRPTRTDERVHELMEICKKCEWYDEASSRCRGCGCRVTEGGIAILNKLRMATEECPKGLWK